jgi:hypothetical protein
VGVREGERERWRDGEMERWREVDLPEHEAKFLAASKPRSTVYVVWFTLTLVTALYPVTTRFGCSVLV